MPTPPVNLTAALRAAGVESQLELLLLNRLERAGLPLGEAQHRFDPRRRFRFDRAWPEHKVAVEVQGGVWTNGRHARGSGITSDAIKFSIAAALGWRVLVMTKPMIEEGLAVDLIAQALGVPT
jgi:hypothetical protein